MKVTCCFYIHFIFLVAFASCSSKKYSSNSDASDFDDFKSLAEFLETTSDSSAQYQAVNDFLRKTESDPALFRAVADSSFRYFYDAESPHLDEERFIPFLKYFSNTTVLDEASKLRFDFLLEVALKNRKGYRAENFHFITPEGDTSSLYDIIIPTNSRLLLIFYDPDCDKCINTLQEMSSSKSLADSIRNNSIYVLAIYAGEELNLWKENLKYLPSQWDKGINLSEIDENDLYFFRSLPSIYLLDSDKRIIYKDMNWQDAL